MVMGVVVFFLCFLIDLLIVFSRFLVFLELGLSFKVFFVVILVLLSFLRFSVR